MQRSTHWQAIASQCLRVGNSESFSNPRRQLLYLVARVEAYIVIAFLQLLNRMLGGTGPTQASIPSRQITSRIEKSRIVRNRLPVDV